MSGIASGAGRFRFQEWEILQHQKEELEMQNKRLVERISKLRFTLEGDVEK
jgi:hypothetical protein